MGALNWLNRLRRNESGNIIAIGAAAMPMLIGSAALAVDTIQLSLWKRQLQRSADSAAIAGAYSLSQSRTDAQIRTSVVNDLADNTHPPLVGAPTVERGPRGTYTKAVYVALTAERTLPFMHMFTGTPARLQADAAAAIVSQGRYCMVSLYNGTDPGITLGGNSSVTLGCGMITNSRSGSAVTTGGTKSFIEATPVGAVGGLDGDGNYFKQPTELLPFTTPQSDPFGDLANPDTSTCTNPVDVSGTTTITTSIGSPACIKSLTVKPSDTVTISGSGPVIVYGGDIDIKGDVKMATGTTGVTLVMTGAEQSDGSVKAGNLTMSSQANLSLTAPTDGDYAGLVFYRDRRAPASTITVRGGADSFLKGAFYAATSNFDFAGNSQFHATCLQMVGQKIAFTGTADLINYCDAADDDNPINRSIVRLVE